MKSRRTNQRGNSHMLGYEGGGGHMLGYEGGGEGVNTNHMGD